MARRAGKLLLKALVTIFLTLVVIEVTVRAIPLYPDTFEVPDPNYGWRLPANISGAYLNILCLGEYSNRIRINSQGLHDVEHDYEAAEGVYRILVIGDSMVAGFEVPLEQTFYRRLETLLNARDDGRTYEVIGAGHRGYGTDLEWLFYEHEGSRYQPDMVVLVIQPGNDIRDNHPALRPPSAGDFPYFTLEGDELRLHKPDTSSVAVNPAVESLNPIHDSLYQISYLYRLLYRRISTIQGVRQTFTQPMAVDESAAQAFAEAWAVTRALIARFRNAVTGEGKTFAVLVASSSFASAEDAQRTYQGVYDILDELDVPYTSLEQTLEPQNTPANRLRYACDQHWTPAGHAFVADQLAAFLPTLITASDSTEQ